MSSVRQLVGKMKRATKKAINRTKDKSEPQVIETTLSPRRMSIYDGSAVGIMAAASAAHKPVASPPGRRLSIEMPSPTDVPATQKQPAARRMSIDGAISVKSKGTQVDDVKKRGDLATLDASPVSDAGHRHSNVFGDEDAASDNADDGTERHAEVDHDALKLPIKVGGNSRAGFSSAPVPGADKATGTRKANQDSYCALVPFANRNHDVFVAVYDGHGALGRPSSQLVRDVCPALVMEHYAESGTSPDDDGTSSQLRSGWEWQPAEMSRRFAALRHAFEESEETLKDPSSGIDHIFSGTTAVAVWIVNQSAFCACSGDSRAIVGRRASDGSLQTVELSYDQKPSRLDEKKRVRAAGGRVTRWKKNVGPLRVWLQDDWIPGLAMTRSIGDTCLSEVGVVPTPEITVTGLGPGDELVVLASDGVWEFMTSADVIAFLSRLRKAGVSPSAAANKLVAEAVRRWRDNETVVDDTTAIVIWLNYTDPPPAGTTAPRLMLEGGALTVFTPINDTEKE
jgi:serine/threonine protein phosphatase PrpC